MGETLEGLPKAALRKLLQMMVPKMEVDLETKAVEMEIAVPSWADLSAAGLCLNAPQAYSWGHQAHATVLLKLDCHWKRQGGLKSAVPDDCLTCHRRAA